MKKTMLALLVVTLAVALTPLASAQGRGNGLHARLTQADAIAGVRPIGKAKYREADDGTPRNLVVRVGRVNLPAGTRVRVDACDGTAGWITLQTGKRGTHTGGRLRLRARDGDAVPTCELGDRAAVTGGALHARGTMEQGRR
jgi:hypothetical protein